ncbi:cytochrome ubiquinol oxidase subunit I [Demequina litorisediminis]|uniref:Uncharacterized protein n=1 Tax=Demequina litorisediminis TaxID=1849022 RepID=A0ABQ6I955_9MICO|nr:hypothetical protein GCM10025876_05770 [Demequina litorisediminis]
MATGIVQEFQFGMNWSEYSRFVGDVFGAPLAMEALAAFFLESTFLGLWIFGWDRLPRKVHLATVWAFAIGSLLSAYFIIAANSWMQHPVGAVYNAETGRAEMTDIWAVLTNNTTLVAFPHVIATAFLVAGTFVAGIAVYWMVRHSRKDKDHADIPMYRTAARFGAVVMLISGLGVVITGDEQAKLMFEQQPIKMAAAEGLIETPDGCAPFSILSIGNLAGDDPSSVKHILEVPCMLSFMATGTLDGPVLGLEDLQEIYAEQYGATTPDGEEIEYRPNLLITYWSFRLMIGLAAFSAALCVAIFWFTRKGRAIDQPWMKKPALISLPMPFLAASLRLDLHRDGPSTLRGRAEPHGRRRDHADDHVRRLRGDHGRRGRHLTDGLHVALRGARRVLVPPHEALRLRGSAEPRAGGDLQRPRPPNVLRVLGVN